MEDIALKAALEKWERLKQDIDTLRNKMAGDQSLLNRMQNEAADLDAWIGKWHELVGRPIPPTAAERIAKTAHTKKTTRPKNPNRKSVAEAVANYIRERGEPLTRREIFDRLMGDGIVIEGKDPEMVLSTMLWREKGIVRRLPGGGYWLTDEQHPLDSVHLDL